MTVPERVRAFVRYKKISVSEFCRTLDVSSSYVSSMSKSMSLKIIQRISLIYPELNILWLQTGEGEMLKRPEDEIEINVSVVPCRECDRKDGKIELLKETVYDLQQQLIDVHHQLAEMTARYHSVASPQCAETKKPDAGGGNGGGGGDAESPSFRCHSMASCKQGKI